jgi:hypothetical protein
VSEQDFVFALNVSGDPDSDQMLADLTGTLLGQVGYPPEGIQPLIAEVRTALQGRMAAGQRQCEVRFRAQGGQLEIVVSGAGIAEWRTSRPLPAS